MLHPWNGTVTSLDGTSTRYIEELDAVDGPPSSSAWSPDSRWIAVQHDGHIVFYDPRSDERVMVAAPWSQDGRGRVQSGLAFSPLAN